MAISQASMAQVRTRCRARGHRTRFRCARAGALVRTRATAGAHERIRSCALQRPLVRKDNRIIGIDRTIHAGIYPA